MDYKTAQELAGYRITPNPDSRPESKDEGQANSPVASPVREEPLPIPNRRRKQTYRVPKGSPPVRSRGEGSRPQPKHRPQPDL